MDANVIILMKQELTRKRIIDLEHDTNAVLLRARGKEFSFEEHVKALVYSLLTNQRRWADIEPKLPRIDKLFAYYDIDEIKSHSGEYYERGIRNMQAGNISIRQQMAGLHYNIQVFENIYEEYGSLDNFVTSEEAEGIVKMISGNGKYKLKGIGPALAWEYLRNVGIDGAKPDVHMKRFMGSNRMGVSPFVDAEDDEVITEVEKLSKETGLTRFEVDFIIWNYCADGKGEICTASPKCHKCVVRDYCKKGK